jgi:hypothetical protein
MTIRSISTILTTLSLTLTSLSYATVLPPNNLYLEDQFFRRAGTGLNEEQFHSELDYLESVYKPIVAAHGASLVIRRLWSNSKVNASAVREGSKWIITMYGGLARRPEITPDAFALAACHEIGHHLGGFPFYVEGDIAVEGQADYFATHACSKLLWADEEERNAHARLKASKSIKQKCNAEHASWETRNLCYRTMLAGVSLSNLLTMLQLGLPVAVDSPSNGVVLDTIDGHPAAQCRLDTFIAGSLCNKIFDNARIPQGPKGMVRTSCTHAGGDEIGFRPACWFKE